jgi:chemotaxis protein methyltransferase CheR
MINKKCNLSETELKRFADLVREKSGLMINKNRHSDLEKAIYFTASKYDSPSLENLSLLLDNHSINNEVLQTFIEQLTIGETSFMRNKPHIEALKKYILPEIIERHKREKEIRIWSAGCSTGEEPYSLAILLKQLIKPFDKWDVKILGTDINTQALKKAQAGIYGEWSFRNVTADFRVDHFNQSGGLFQILPEYRRMVEFAYLNLISSDYKPVINSVSHFDLILCKNVFLYFSEDNSRKVIRNFFDLLKDPGWLMIGPSETSQNLFEKYRTYNFPDAIVYQKNSRDEENEFRLIIDRPNNSTAMRTNLSTSNSDILFLEGKKFDDNLDEKESLFQTSILQTQLPISDLSNSTKTEENWAALVKEVEEDEENHIAAYRLAKTFANQNELNLATVWVQKTIDRNSLFAPAYYLNSLILDEQGDLDKSLAAIRRCLFLDPKFLMGYYKMAELFKKTGEEKRFLKTLLLLEKELAQVEKGTEIPESDGLTTNDLLTYIKNQKELLI